MPDGSVAKDLAKWGKSSRPNECRWWQTHIWSKWIIVHKGKYNGWPVIIQERVCERCGYTERKTIYS